MKKILVLLAALVATATTGFAQAPASAGRGVSPQPGPRPQASPEQQADRRALPEPEGVAVVRHGGPSCITAGSK